MNLKNLIYNSHHNIRILKYSKFIRSIRILVKYSNSPSPNLERIGNLLFSETIHRYLKISPRHPSQ